MDNEVILLASLEPGALSSVPDYTTWEDLYRRHRFLAPSIRTQFNQILVKCQRSLCRRSYRTHTALTLLASAKKSTVPLYPYPLLPMSLLLTPVSIPFPSEFALQLLTSDLWPWLRLLYLTSPCNARGPISCPGSAYSALCPFSLTSPYDFAFFFFLKRNH